MSVIIRLQNLPWSANALDIRQFFKGLSIPEGGVHIVGGEMGDAFIAFSTDEDARQAMMNDRKSIKEVQVRLLLSSRAEMQKVIETARLQSISLLQQMAVRTAAPLDTPTVTPNGGGKLLSSQLLSAKASLPKVQAPPIAMNNLFGHTTSFLTYQQQAGITLTGSPVTNEHDPKNRSDSSSLNDSSIRSSFEGRGSRDRDRIRSSSRDRIRSSSRDRHRDRRDERSHSRDRDYERGRDRERDRDTRNHRQERSHRSRSRDSRERSVDRPRNRAFNRSGRRSNSKERDTNNRSGRETNVPPWSASLSPVDKPKTTTLSPWGSSPINAYQSNQYQTTASNSYSTSSTSSKENVISLEASATRSANTSNPNLPEAVIPAFQNYTSNITNNYSVSLLGSIGGSNSNSSDSMKPFVLQNPYTTALQNANADSDSQATNSSVPGATASQTSSTSNAAVTTSSFQTLSQEPIAFAKTNPYEQMYPNLFAQAAAQSMPRSNATAAQRTGSPVYKNNEPIAFPESSSIKISNMCTSTNYSDLRKFFAGLFIPHNGIKMVNDRHGLRIGVAFIQFSRQSSVAKALTRNHSILKSKSIKIEVVPDDEFTRAEDSYRPSSRFDRQNHNDGDQDRRFDGQGNSEYKNPFKKQNEEVDSPFNVLYIEELPPLTTEQDIMKMFSSYTLYDILLMPSVDNRREYVAYVKFSLAEDAKAAFEDKSKHLIGYRKVRVQPGKEESMDIAKEKLRLANEQLMKEEEEEEQEKEAARIAASFNENRNELSPVDNEFTITEIIADSTSETSMTEMPPTRVLTRDPRLIPSLFDMPATKPLMDGTDSIKPNTSPADPRLRTRQRPSRFDNDTKNLPSLNDSSNNNDINNSSNNNNNNNNGNGHQQMPLNNNQFHNNNNSNSNNSNGNFNDMFRYQQQINTMENSFVLLYNCPYNIRNNDVGELFISANLNVKHIEMLNTERGIPAGEFIVEVSDPREADLAVKDFHNIQFHGRSLRVRHIKPQEIADRLGKPFMNYMPGGNGNNGGFGFNNMGNSMFMNSGGNRHNNFDGDMNFNGNNNSMGGMHGGSSGGGSPVRRKRGMQSGNSGRSVRGGRNNYDDNDDGDFNDDDSMRSRGGRNSGDSGSNKNGIPEKFTRPNCVLAMENVPYKADSEDILRFFGSFKLRADDIIRRFNDEGAPTGDARVAFQNASDAREAYEKLNRKLIFGRTIYLNVL